MTSLKAERNGASSSFEEFGYLRKRGRYLEPLVYNTTHVSRDKKHGDAHSERLRYSWCESKRVSVRTWYAFLSTYDRMNFYEVPFNFDAAHTKRGKPSKPVIPAFPSMIERECAKGSGFGNRKVKGRTYILPTSFTRTVSDR